MPWRISRIYIYIYIFPFVIFQPTFIRVCTRDTCILFRGYCFPRPSGGCAATNACKSERFTMHTRIGCSLPFFFLFFSFSLFFRLFPPPSPSHPRLPVLRSGGGRIYNSRSEVGVSVCGAMEIQRSHSARIQTTF